MSRRDRDPNRGRRKTPLSWFSVADEMGLNNDDVVTTAAIRTTEGGRTIAEVDLDYLQFSEEELVLDSDRCKMCRKPIRTMVFRGTGYCSQSCQEAPF